jgi:hypothetical protein
MAVNLAQSEDAFQVPEKYSVEAIRIIKECEVEAEKILTRNKLLLLKMAEYLTVNSKMEEPLIEEYVKKYGNESWLETEGLIKKDEYYHFNTMLREQLAIAENEAFDSVIEKIVGMADENALLTK